MIERKYAKGSMKKTDFLHAIHNVTCRVWVDGRARGRTVYTAVMLNSGSERGADVLRCSVLNDSVHYAAVCGGLLAQDALSVGQADGTWTESELKQKSTGTTPAVGSSRGFASTAYHKCWNR